MNDRTGNRVGAVLVGLAVAYFGGHVLAALLGMTPGQFFGLAIGALVVLVALLSLVAQLMRSPRR